MMEPGRIIEFWENKKIVAAVCLEVKGAKLHILTENNRQASLSSSRVIHSSDYRLDLGLSRDEIVQRLKGIVEKRRKLKEEILPAELWELLQGEGESFSFEKLAELWFGQEISSDDTSALQRALAEDRIYFRLKGDNYLLNPCEAVEQNCLKLEREREKQLEVEGVSQWLKHIWSGKILPLNPFAERFVETLRQIAIFGQESPEYKRSKEILEKAELTPELSFQILVKLGIWREDENLIPYKYLTPIDFPEEVHWENEKICQEAVREDPEKDQGRADLTDLEIFSIDSATTLDIDDALSLGDEAGVWKLGIHIADTAHYIQTGSVIDEIAMERATSIYLPDTKIPMLPPSLSESLISLNPEERKRALSLMVSLDSDGEIQDFHFLSSWIKNSRRMSYDDVDFTLGKENKLQNLYDLTLKLREKRLKAGAKNFASPELEISVDESRKIALIKRERETPSQILVSECMILANHLAAEFCRNKGITIIYRSQSKPSEDLYAISEYDPVFYFRIRRLLTRAELGTSPKPHAGLGLDCYTNFTSPIRRYADLIVERQITKYLRGEKELHGEEELKNTIFLLEPALSRASTVQQESKRYWLLKYLEKHKGEEIPAIVLDVLFNRYIILLEPYLMETEFSYRGGRELKPGDRIMVRLDGVNSRENFMKLSLL